MIRFALLLACVSAFEHVGLTRLRRQGIRPCAMAPSAAMKELNVAFVVDMDKVSTFGGTSPVPYPPWPKVATQLAKRLKIFDSRMEGIVIDQNEEDATVTPQTAVVALGADYIPPPMWEGVCLIADETCASDVKERAFVGSSAKKNALTAPWSQEASHARALESATKLLNRKSTEDVCYAIMLVLNQLVTNIPVVSTDINPSWEKGLARNVREFKTMIECCGPEIVDALTDPQTKRAIDLLNACDLRDQVGSYRVIVSNETPQLEAFSQCILQQHNCFGANASILDRPKVPVLTRWCGRIMDQNAAASIFCGHRGAVAWSWRVVCGANPAYDAFPMQHQIFYPAAQGDALWYDPVFLVETLDGRYVWTKRHYRCMPRAQVPGLWTLTTLDNGVVSKEHWTTVDCADDLEWAIFHYSGAAKNAGQSYQGALLCSRSGMWPQSATEGTPSFYRILKSFQACGLELFELYGCGPPTERAALDEASFMWSAKYQLWAADNPPPLDIIGDISIAKWRESQRKLASSSEQVTVSSMSSP